MENQNDIQILKDFLTDLHNGAAYRYLWIVAPETAQKQTLWYSNSDKGTQEIITFLERTRDRYNIHFGIHGLFEKKNYAQRAKETDTLVVNAFYADFDFKERPKFQNPLDFIESIFSLGKKDLPRLLPSYIVSSGGGYHAYWLLAEPIVVTDANREAVKAMQKDWVHRLGADPAACDLARVLRLPLSINFKYENKPQCRVIFASKVKHNINDFQFKLETNNQVQSSFKNQVQKQRVKLVPLNHACKESELQSANKTLNLDSLVKGVRDAKEGTRNSTLNRNAFLAFLNAIKNQNDKDVWEVFNTLALAAKETGLSEKEIESTLNSALRGAKKKLNF